MRAVEKVDATQLRMGGLDYDKAQLIEASSLKRLLHTHPSKSVARLRRLVSVEMVMKWVHEEAVKYLYIPSLRRVEPDEDEKS